MRRSSAILTFLFLAFCYAANLPMQQWEARQGTPTERLQWSTNPTWWAVVSLARAFPDKQVDDISPTDVVEVAGLMYKWLEETHSDFNKIATHNGYCLVAVLWDPEKAEFIASTIPQGPRRQTMLDLAGNPTPFARHGAASAWYGQVQDMINRAPKNPPFHAEDGVLFHWENRSRNRVVNGQFPSNLVLGIYGKAIVKDTNDGNKIKTIGPRVWDPCGAGADADTRTPTCQDVARGLGITQWATQRQRRDDLGFATIENQADYVGEPLTADDIAAAKVVEIACGVSDVQKRFHRRQEAAACRSYLDPSPQSSATIASHSDIASITKAPTVSKLHSSSTTPSAGPKPSCTLQNEDPDQGINSQYCVCQSTVTLPLLSITGTAVATAACNYQAIPSSKITKVSTGFHSTTTNPALCEVCSKVVNNEDACTSMPNCVPRAAKASVTVATSPLHVGTLTGESLYTSVSNALVSICPPVTQTTSTTKCSGTATIKGITYIEEDNIAYDGELEVFAAFSEYNQTSLRDAMIDSLAISAAKSATGKNCYNASYTIIEKRDEREWMGWYDTLFRRNLAVRDHPEPQFKTIQLCNMAELALVNYYSPLWRLAPEPGPTDYIEAQYKFHITNGDFVCEFLEILADALVTIEPEFAVADVELGEEMRAICENLT